MPKSLRVSEKSLRKADRETLPGIPGPTAALLLAATLAVILCGPAAADHLAPLGSQSLVEVAEPLPPAAPLVAPAEPLPVPPAVAEEAPIVPLGLLRSAEEVEVLETLDRWVDAWWRQKVEAYLDFYAADFRLPDSLDRDAWEELRRERLSAPTFISIRIESPRVIELGESQYQAQFIQHYRSDSYQDTVYKVLDLTREGGRWKIQREESRQPVPEAAQASL